MPCPERIMIVKHLHGELGENEVAEVEKHLAECLDCNVLSIDLKQASAALHGGGRTKPAPGCPPRDVLATYVEGSLRDDQMKKLEKHISICDHCVSELAALYEEKKQRSRPPVLGPGQLQKLRDLPASDAARAPETPAAPRRSPAPAARRGVPAMAAETPAAPVEDKAEYQRKLYKMVLGAAAALLLVVVLYVLMTSGSGGTDPADADRLASGDTRASETASGPSGRASEGREIALPPRPDSSGVFKKYKRPPAPGLGTEAPKPKPEIKGLESRDVDAKPVERETPSYEEEFGDDPVGGAEPGAEVEPEPSTEPTPAPKPVAPIKKSEPAPVAKKTEPAGEKEVAAKKEEKPIDPVECLSIFDGVIEVKEPDSKTWQKLSENSKLTEKTELRTDRKEGRFFVTDKLSVSMDRKTHIVLGNYRGKPMYELVEGELFVEAFDLEEYTFFKLREQDAVVKIRFCNAHIEADSTAKVAAQDGGCRVERGDQSMTVSKGHRLSVRKDDDLSDPSKSSSALKRPSWTEDVHLAKKVVHGDVKVMRDGSVIIEYDFRDDDEMLDFHVASGDARIDTRRNAMFFELSGDLGTVVSKLVTKGDISLEYYIFLSKGPGAHLWALGTTTGDRRNSRVAGVYPTGSRTRGWRRSGVPAEAIFLVDNDARDRSRKYIMAGKSIKVSVDRKGDEISWLTFDEEVGDPEGRINNFALGFYGPESAFVTRLVVRCFLDDEWMVKKVFGKDDEKRLKGSKGKRDDWKKEREKRREKREKDERGEREKDGRKKGDREKQLRRPGDGED